MAKFNTVAERKNVTVNYEGAKVYELDSNFELYTLVCNSLLADKYYEPASEQLRRIVDLVQKCDPEFVANLASYARNEMYLRTIPVILAVLLCRSHGGSLARKTISRVVKRADEITEVMSFFFAINQNVSVDKITKQTKQAVKVPKSLLKGLKDVFESDRFKEYHFGKYNTSGKAVKFRDVLFLTHPKPVSEAQKELFEKIAEDKLATPYTWETELSQVGQDAKDDAEKAELKKAKWAELINSGKLGYMALLRNLRNILNTKPETDVLDKVCDTLKVGAVDAKQFPFRFWSAYRELAGIKSRGGYFSQTPPEGFEPDPYQLKEVLNALNVAIVESLKVYPEFEGNIMIASDVSGSMHSTISPKSSIMNYDIGLVLGAIVNDVKPKSVQGIFGNTFKVINLTGNILDNVANMHKREGEVGYSTNGWTVIDYLLKNKLSVNNVLLFTDCQLWDSTHGRSYAHDPKIETLWKQYKAKNPEARLWIFDLAGYGTTPIEINKRSNVIMVAGWSDRVFEAVRV